MVTKKNFIILYIALFWIILFFLFLYIILTLNIKIPLFSSLFQDKNLEVISKITYIQGSENYYSHRGKKKLKFDHNTQIKSDMIIETGSNSYIGFFIKDHGFYYLYPDTSLYIKKIENYNSEKSIKESVFELEKGILLLDINFYSINSNLILETHDCFCTLNEARAVIDKTGDFSTKIICLEGKINYRAYSEKFEFFENKKNYIITNSIDRLINSSNVLGKDEITTIDVSYQNKLDNLLNKIYESQNTNLINKEYITSYLNIPSGKASLKDKISYIFPAIDINKFSFSGSGHLEISTPNDQSVITFRNENLKNGTQYLFYLDSGKYQVEQTCSFTKIISSIQVSENDFKNLTLKNFYGISDIYINNIKSLFSTMSIKGQSDYENAYILKIENTSGEVKNLTINSDLALKELYLLNDKSEENQLSASKIKINLNDTIFSSYRIESNDKTGFQINFNPSLNDKELFFLVKFEDLYIFDY
jgi:hypothetical protein